MDQVSYYIEKHKERNSDVGREIDINADGEADTDTLQSTSSNEDNNSRKTGNKKAHLISRSSSTSASPPKKRQLRGRKSRSSSDDDTTSDNQSNSCRRSKKNNSNNNTNVNNKNIINNNNNDLKKKKRSLTTTIETKYNVGFKPKKVSDTKITKLIEKINSNINFKILNRKSHKQEHYSDLIKNVTTPINFYKLAKEVKFPLNDPNTNNNIRKVLEFRDTLQQLNVPENEYHEYTLSLIQFLQYYILSNNYRQQRGGSKKNKKTNTFIHRFLCRTVKTKENPNNNTNNNNSSDTRNISPSDDGKEKILNHNHLGRVSSEILDVNGCTRCPWNEIFYFNFSENWVKIQIKGSHQNHTFDRILKDRSCVLLDNYVKDMIDTSITTEVNSDSLNEDNNFENLDSKLDHDVLEKIGAFFFKGKKVDYLKKKRKLEKELSTEGKINGGVNNVINNNNSEIGNVNIVNKKKDDVPNGNNTKPLNSEIETGNNTKNEAVVNSNNPEINREINLIMDANETSTNNAIMAASNSQPNAKSVKYHPHPHPHPHYHHHPPERRIKHEEKSLKDLLNSESDSSDSLEMKCDKTNDDPSCNNGSKIEIIRNDDDSDMGGINSVSGSNSDTNSMNGMDTSEKNGSIMTNSRSSRMSNMSNDPSSASSSSTSNPDSNSNSNPDSSGSSPPSNTGGSNDNGSDTNINYELNGNQDNNNARNNSVSSTFLNSSNSSSSSSSMEPSLNVVPSLTITALNNNNDNKNNYDEVTYKTGADNKVVYTSETAPLDNNTNDNGINNKSGTTQNSNAHNGIGFMSKMRDMQERGLRKTFDSCIDQIHGLQDLFYDLNDSELSREDKLLFNMKLAKELKATFEKSMEISKNIKQSAKSKKL